MTFSLILASLGVAAGLDARIGPFVTLYVLVVTSTSAPLECGECVEGGADWVHLRLCLSCGLVACCDDSRLQHASAHFAQTSHPLIASLEPGDDWRWCFVDQTLVVGPPAPAPEQRS